MKNKNELTTEPIPGLIGKITIPVSIGLFFNTMYNVVDTWFAGMISTSALAAMSLSLPVFFIIISVGSGMSTGTTALIGTALGADDKKQASLYAVQGLVFGVLMSFLLAVTGINLSPFLFKILGASDEYLHICLAYMDVLFNGTVFFMLMYMLNAILNAQGNTRIYRNFLIMGFILNIILDPWFVFGGLGIPPMGVTGVAFATVLIQMIGSIFLGINVKKTGLISVRSWKDFLPDAGAFKQIAAQGFPASLNIMTVAMGVFVITYFVSKFGKEAVAAYGIGMRVEQIVLLPAIGLNTATLTLVAQNHGAGLFNRMIEAFRSSLKYGGIMTAVGGILVLIFAKPFMKLFSNDPKVIEIGISYLKIEALVLYAYVILFVSVAALQGIKKPMFAVFIGLFRQIFAPVIVFYTLTQVYDFGVMGIWVGILSITWTAAIIAIFYAKRTMKKEMELK